MTRIVCYSLEDSPFFLRINDFMFYFTSKFYMDKFNKENNINSFLLYLIDLLYICDFCISFFRGYYNLQYRLIRNNITIIIHYFKTDFFFDFLESIPIYTFSNYLCTKNREVNYCFKYSMSNSLIILKIATNIKIIKIFKIRNRQRNTTLYFILEVFSENYYFEKLLDNLMDFLLFI